MSTATIDRRKLSDRRLICAYRDGDSMAASTLIERHKRRVTDYINMMVRDRALADDIFQETFIKVLRFLDEGRYTDNGKFLSWVLRIAHNQVIDFFRSRRLHSDLGDAQTGHDVLNNSRFSDPNIEQSIVSEQIERDIRGLVDALPEEQREVVYLRYFEGMTFKDIAYETSVSINTALGRMRYALINLRKMIREKNMTLTLD